jgi:hypothetical protein
MDEREKVCAVAFNWVYEFETRDKALAQQWLERNDITPDSLHFRSEMPKNKYGNLLYHP